MSDKTEKNFPETSDLIFPDKDGKAGEYVLEYPDYLSAVYSFADVLKEKHRTEGEIDNLEKRKNDTEKDINSTSESMKDNREKRTLRHDNAIEERKQIFKKTQERLDVKIAQETLSAKDEANKIIRKRKEALEKKKSELLEKERKLIEDNDIRKSEIRDLEREQDALDNYTGENIPIENEEVLELLASARQKKLFASYQQKLMDEPVDKICKNRVRNIEDLIHKERKFAESDIVKSIKKGKVTSKVIAKFSNAVAAACLAVTLLCALLSLILPLNSIPSLCLSIVDLGLSGAFAGGVLMAIVEHIGKRYWFDDELSNEDRSLLILCFVVGVIGGFFLWKFVLFGKAQLWFILYYLLASITAALVVRRFLRLDICTKQLSKLEFLKNRARKNIFKNAVGKKKGWYDLLIYCYINHNAVVGYLSMDFRDRKILANTNRQELDRNIVTVNKQEAEKLKLEWENIRELEKEMNEENKITEDELAEKIKKIESQRRDIIDVDFESELSQKVLDDLNSLDNEFADLRKIKLSLQSDYDEIVEKYNTAKKQLIEISSDYKVIVEAIREWNKSPLPIETDFKLCDTFCLELGNKIGLIKHNLEPTLIKYVVSKEHSDPITPIIRIVTSCIKGLMKINPKNMIQFSIIDPVSDPRILISDKEINEISQARIIRGTYSLNGCEIRLLDSYESFRVFMNSLSRRISDLRFFLKEKADYIPDDAPKNYDLANRLLRSDDSPYTYQIMIFIVPRSADVTDFPPPGSVRQIIREKIDIYKTGIFPIFLAEDGNIHNDWKDIISLINTDNIYRIGSKKASK